VKNNLILLKKIPAEKLFARRKTYFEIELFSFETLNVFKFWRVRGGGVINICL
jgi:hypothetical protein